VVRGIHHQGITVQSRLRQLSQYSTYVPIQEPYRGVIPGNNSPLVLTREIVEDLGNVGGILRAYGRGQKGAGFEMITVLRWKVEWRVRLPEADPKRERSPILLTLLPVSLCLPGDERTFHVLVISRIRQFVRVEPNAGRVLNGQPRRLGPNILSYRASRAGSIRARSRPRSCMYPGQIVPAGRDD
jgi:hypothetical protein